MRKHIRRPEGFTLIELMIVILIIAILVAIAVPVYLSARENAQRRTCQSNIRTVDGAIQSYEVSGSDPVYPHAMYDLTSPGTKVLKSIPRCPKDADYVMIGSNPPTISCPKQADHSL